MVHVGIIMGSQSDWPTMKHAADILDALKISYESKIVSAHRTPDRLWAYSTTAIERGLKVIILLQLQIVGKGFITGAGLAKILDNLRLRVSINLVCIPWVVRREISGT